MSKQIKTLTIMAMLVAISVVLVYAIHMPLFPSAAFLEYDPADISILIGGFLFGPGAGIILTVLASAVQAFTVSAQNGIYGFLMHVIATSALVLTASIIYKKKPTEKGAILGLICGTVAMCAVMLVANHYITSYYFQLPTSVVDGMLLPVILPFNFIKAGVNSIIAFLLFKVLKNRIKEEG